MATSRGNGTISIFYDFEGLWQVCVKDDRTVGSFGIFLGDYPFDFVLPATLIQLFVIILTSQTLHFFLKPLGTPKFICNVLGGILLGPSFLGRNKSYWEALFPARQAQALFFLATVGAAYFLFIITLKMDIIMTIRAAKSTWRLGIIPFMASFVVISTLLNFYHLQNIPYFKLNVSHAVLSVTMAVSNFPVMSEALTELNLISTELGQIALSSAILNDNIQWFLVVIQRLIEAHEVKYSIIYLVCFLSFILFSIYILRPVMQLIARKTPVGKPVKEIYIVFILLGVLVMAGMSDMIGATILMGPTIYGLVIPSGPPLGTTLVEKCEVVISEFLLPFFFITIGMNTNLSAIQNWREFITLQSILIAGDLAKVFACMLVCLTYNIKAKHGTILGLILNIKGITELVAIAKMKKLQLLDEETFSHLVLSMVVMTSIITPMVQFLYKHRPRVLNASCIHEGQTRTIQSTPRNSEFRIVTCVHSEGNVRGITTLLEACNPALESPLCVYVIHLIELIGQSAPILLPINYNQNKKLLFVNYPNTNHIMRAFQNYSKNSSGPVTVLPYVNVAPYKSMHDAICNLAQDKMVPFLIIPFHENDHIDLDSHVATSIRKLNTRFQDNAPCALGILVDRYSRLGANNDSKLYFHVGIFFIGGPDDREALALGIRMSERPNMRVSLFRFIVMNKKLCGSKNQSTKEEEKAEDMLDEGLIDELRGRKFGSGNVTWYEIVVEDGIEVLDAIRSLEGNYDLVMVGRRHNIRSLNDEEMANFIENAEILGIFGDMLSSTEFCIGMVPVLVTQCGGDKVNTLDKVGSINASQSKRSIVVEK